MRTHKHNLHTAGAYRWILAILLAGALASCERRDWTDVVIERATIPVSIDWSLSGMDPENDPDQDLYRASVWLFSKNGAVFDGKTYCEYRLNSPYGGEISVPVGRYSALIFNNSVIEVSSNVAFRGTDKYETFEYYSLADADHYSKITSYILEPDMLAAWHADDFEVTAAMVRTPNSRTTLEECTSLLHVQPLPLVWRCNTQAHVNQLVSAAGAQGIVHGTGVSVYLATGRVPAKMASTVFPFTNWMQDTGFGANGTMYGHINTFGPQTNPSATYSLQISFALNGRYNGSTTWPTPPTPAYSFDVTQQVRTSTDYLINLRIGEGLIQGEKLMELPATGNNSSGFDAEVTPWEDEEVTELNF